MSVNNLIIFGRKQFENSSLAAILNLSSFVIFTQLKIKAKLLDHVYRTKSEDSHKDNLWEIL